MVGDPQEVAERFHEVLVETLHRGNRPVTDRYVTVSDIYYELAPFDRCRKKLGVDSIFDYERALLEILSGQSGYLEVESLADRQRLERETRYGRIDPNRFRDFLHVGVRIRAPVGPVSQERNDERQAEQKEETPGQSLEEEVSPPLQDGSPRIQECPSCFESLPQKATVSFCPFCGADIRRVLCPSCHESLRLEWRFCAACGTQVESKEETPGLH